MKRSIISIAITISILLAGVNLVLDRHVDGSDFSTRRQDHSPISIDGNTQVLSRASTEGWPGTGTQGDPIVISNYRINAGNGIGIALYNIDLHVTISDMIITNSDPASILIYSSFNIEINNNLIYHIKVDGIKLDSSNNCSVNNNTMDEEDIITIGRNGIKLEDSNDNSVKDNRIARMGNDGISILGSSTRNLIKDNVIIQCQNNAILVRSENNQVIGNQGTSSGWGARIRGSDNLVSGNWFRRNGYGIYVSEAGENLIHDNICNRNYIGINIVLSVNNLITDNYIGKSASYGMDLYTNQQSNNVVYSNHFYYNNNTNGAFKADRIQARDLNTGNTWYDEETNRGNFWFDWRGNDNDGDGIVDLSYPIEGDGSRDLYPLLIPTKPDAFIPPWKLRASPQPTYIDIIWEAPFYGMGVNVRSYHIYRSERGGGEFYIDSVDGDTKTYRDSDVISGRAYFYYIIALNDIGFSNQSMRVKSSPDTQRPSLTIESPEDGDIFATTSVKVIYQGMDNIALDRYEVSLDDGEPINKGLWGNITFLGLSEGEHTVSITVFDLAEHSRTKSVTFLIDITPPVIEIDKPQEGIIISSIRSPKISWTANDDGSGIGGYHLSLDGSPYSNIGFLPYHTFSELDPGTHKVSIMVKDLAGNENNDSVTLLINPNAPSLNIISPLHYYVNNTGNIDFRWYGSDTGTGIDRYLIRWGQEEWFDLGNSTTYRVTGLSEGSHTIYLKAFDKAENNVTHQRIVTVDRTPPEIELRTPGYMQRFSDPFNIDYSASDLLTGIGKIRFRVEDEDWRTFKPDDVIKVGPMENGIYEFFLEVSDNAGNTNSVSDTFIYDISQPLVVDYFPRGEDVSIDTDVKLLFSERMDVDSVLVDIAMVDGKITWDDRNMTISPENDLLPGKTYSIRVTGKDLAGNVLVPFEWSFVTEVDIESNQGMVTGRVIDTATGNPVTNATVRFRSGESISTDMNGNFSIIIQKGDNHLIVSATGYQDTKVEFVIEGTQKLDLGDIPIKMTYDDHGETSDKGNMVLIIILIIVIIILIFALFLGYQIKKTRDYANQPPIPDEWVNGKAVPLREQMEEQMGPANEGLNR